MSRNENENITHLKLPDPKTSNQTYYMENGSVLDDEQFAELIKGHKAKYTKPPMICAKTSFNLKSRLYTFYILCAGSMLFDPRNTDSRYRIRNRWLLRRVKKSVFELYLKFLNTSHKTHLFQAERGI